ncbi:MAG: 50S ribosomal protein L20 [Dehalococcoidia bacterium]
MPRVKSGPTTKHRHNKVVKSTKGHKATKHTRYKTAHESMLHALSHAYRHRRERKGDMRRLWITRINAAARQEGLSYSALMHGLREAGVQIDRKMLADMAVRDPKAFSQIAEVAKGST